MAAPVSRGDPPSFEAVLFDLWGTLVPFSTERRDAVSRLMAADLGVDPETFVEAVRASHGERFLGETGSLVETVALLAARCGGTPSRVRLELAAARRLDLMRAMLAGVTAETPRVLDELRARGLRLGLVSDSSVETPALWSGSPLSGRFDAAAFSCLLGSRKPDGRIYRHVLAQLGVAAERCVYVGDGDSHELTGAARLGMTAVCLSPLGRHDHYEHDEGFRGPAIRSLAELPRLLVSATATTSTPHA